MKSQQSKRIPFSWQPTCCFLSLFFFALLISETSGFHVPSDGFAFSKRKAGRTRGKRRAVEGIRIKENPQFSMLSLKTTATTTELFNGMWSQDDELIGVDRYKACIPYILPLLDGNHFGFYIYQRIPLLGAVSDFFLGPLLNIYDHIPFAPVILFAMLTVGTRFNTDMNRNVRFSAQQAALLDIALIFPELFGNGPSEGELPRYILEPCNTFVWYTYMAAIVYSVYCNLNGKKPDQIPYISAFSDLMVGPF